MNPLNADLLRAIAEQIGESSDISNEGIDLSRVIKAGLQTISQSDAAVMESICRRIDVSKTLRTGYALDWGKLPGSLDAPIELWIGAIALLLISCERFLEAFNEDGRSLKYLNSALKALELAQNLPSESGTDRALQQAQIHQLHQWANTLVATAITAKAAT